ncbi:MAG: sulfatase [Acidobacteriota bacterium]|jgi:arylsulfatase A-like enzyme
MRPARWIVALAALAGAGPAAVGVAPAGFVSDARGAAVGAQSGQRPNILFVFTDDHSERAISAYGSQINNTPNLDRLADEGMLFRNAFVTNSLCAPSRAVILTGKHSHLNGIIDNRLEFDGAQVTFPKLLQQAGYQTAVVGKWHLKSDPTGFDYWSVLRGQGPYYNPLMLTAGGEVEHTGYTTEIITDVALDWLQNARDPDRPFMLMYQHKAPHRRWEPGPGYMTMYEDMEIPEPATLFDDQVSGNRTSARLTQDMTIAETMDDRDVKLVPPGDLDEEQLAAWNEVYEPRNETFRAAGLSGDDLVRWKYQRYIKDYLRAVAAVDDQLGRVLDYLDASGLADNTVVVYSSDQGFFLGDHGWFDKRWMYEESLRTPLIVRWPGVTAPASIDDHLVQNLDFAQTFLDVAGVGDAPGTEQMQGMSLVPLLRGAAAADWRTSIYYHYYEFPAVHSVQRHYGVRTERYKLIHYYDIDEWELFDLQDDPEEMVNLYDEPGYEAIVASLKEELARLRTLYAVPEVDPDRGGS